ncbi:permease [Paenibacillus baekrokdamisoli]|uniref:Permease n=1 Tax=Paenibacillus baekrokdamisoli TaxID=1712516 RepID=A0A3G9J270_9BACL|nr:TIGR02206 family membrane protein [Paenibacillus baekrokdamisoli]MBB3071310.1 putative integral membrane protein (TIGR02206 family) [Paenibacillus baekrokdamisoli]BBH24652.1 permease [Paenibacillus baekrokdamisoli]
MSGWFDARHAKPFIAYSEAHIGVLVFLLLLMVLLYLFRKSFRTTGSKAMRYGLAAVLVLCELSLNLWYIQQGVFHSATTLPLELCSISLYLSVFMLLFRSRFLFRIVYFTGLGGALQALATPVLGFGFPHYRFLEFFIAHGVIIISVLYMVWVEGFKPTFRSAFTAFAWLNAIAVPVVYINTVTGGNYMFLARKPDTASLLDLLGPYPFYILSLEAVALIMFLLLYLPFSPLFAAKTVANKNVAEPDVDHS